MCWVASSRFYFFVLLFIAMLFSSEEAWSASGKAGPAGSFAVRVNPINIPVLKSGTRKDEIMTVFVIAKSKLAVRTICYYMPRIQDALIQDFHGDPLTHSSFKQLHLGSKDKRIFKAIYKAMKRSKSVKRVHAIAGAQRPQKTVTWAQTLKLEICKQKKKDDKKKDSKKH